jgi:predicted DNA-binding protein
MFGKLEDGDRLATREEKAIFVEKMFDISVAAAEMLILYEPVSVEDFELCVDLLQRMKQGAEKLINGQLGKNKV